MCNGRRATAPGDCPGGSARDPKGDCVISSTETIEDWCNKELTDVMGLFGARLDEYMMNCSMRAEDWNMSSEGKFQVRDNTNICSERCQSVQALRTGVSPPSPELSAKCSEGASKQFFDAMEMMLSRVQVLDRAWEHCGDLFAPVESSKSGVVFVVDVSKSMGMSTRGTSPLTTMKKELKRAIRGLDAQTQAFTLIQFSDKWSAWESELQPASNRTKQSAITWVNQMAAWGETDIAAALLQAVSIRNVDVVYLLSDGMPHLPHGASVCKRVECMPTGSVPIHTTLFMPGAPLSEKEAPQRLLTEIARASGGNFRNIQS